MGVEVRIKHDDLVQAVRELLERAGVPSSVREVEAEVMVEADLTGVPSHGVRMLPGLLKALHEDRIRRDPRLRLLRQQGASCLLDCDLGPGRYVSVQGMHFAVEKARTFGIGICLAARTSHWGRAHAYAYRAAREDMIGLCTTNSMPSMFLPGSIRSVLGNNPLAIASPRGFGRDPIVLDMALTQAAVGKIATYLREGKDVPLGWGLDESGQPTRNAAAILASRKFLPMGGYKGYGLCLMMEILTAVLAGGLLGFEILRADSSSLDPDSSKLFVAVNIEAFGDKDSFFRKSDLLLQNLCDAADSGEDVLFPGERGWRTRDRYLLEGIPIHPEIVNQLRAIGMPI